MLFVQHQCVSFIMLPEICPGHCAEHVESVCAFLFDVVYVVLDA